MNALLLKAPYELEIIEREKPVPQTGEALVRVLSAAICGSEIHGYRGKHFGRKPPAIMGHEVCGIVEALGEGAKGPAIGTRVVAIPQRTCRTCYWCRAGMPNLCSQRLMLGFTDWPGAYEDYFVIPADLLLPIPDNLTPQQGTLIEPFAVSVHAIRRLGVKLGDSVVVIGSGAIGLLAILAAKAAGASKIIATDISEYNLKLAKKMGATHIHNSRSGPVTDFARSLTKGLGPDHAVLAVAAPGLLDETIATVRNRGGIAVVATYTSPLELFIQDTQFKEQAILGSVTYDSEDFRIAIELASSHQVRMASLVTHEFALEKAREAFELADKRLEDQVRVVFNL